MPNPIGYFEVIGRDHEARAAFFGDLFGWEVNRAGPGGYSFAGDLGGTTKMPPTEVGHGIEAALFEDPEGHVIGLVSRSG